MDECKGLLASTFCSVSKAHGVPADVACAVARLAHVVSPSAPLQVAHGAVGLLKAQGHDLGARGCPVTGAETCSCAAAACEISDHASTLP